MKNFFPILLATSIPTSACAQSAMPVLNEDTRQLVAVAVVVYILPIFIAFWRKHPSKWSIVVVNLIFGFTGIGWVAALIWAFGSTKSAVVINHHYSAPGVASTIETAPTAMPVANKSISEKIGDLKAMLDSGTISQTEFELLKKEAMKAIS